MQTASNGFRQSMCSLRLRTYGNKGNTMQTVTLIPTESIRALARQLDGLVGEEFGDGRHIAVKVHMGEYGNLHYLRPPIVGRVVEVLTDKGASPFLFDTPVLYGGPRGTAAGYLDVARKNGFTLESIGCPIVIADQYVTIQSSLGIGSIEVPRELLEADGLVVLTHFKGHADAAFGGCIKNLGMGCVSIETKGRMHKALPKPVVDDDTCTQCLTCVETCPAKALTLADEAITLDAARCWGCGACEEVCPEGAIAASVANLRQLLAEAASIVLGEFTDKPTLFVNVLLDMTELCDCDPRPGRRIADDIGYLIAASAVAIDKASVDLVNEQLGRDFFAEHYAVNPMVQLEVGKRLGLGDLEYKLLKVEQKKG